MGFDSFVLNSFALLKQRPEQLFSVLEVETRVCPWPKRFALPCPIPAPPCSASPGSTSLCPRPPRSATPRLSQLRPLARGKSRFGIQIFIYKKLYTFVLPHIRPTFVECKTRTSHDEPGRGEARRAGRGRAGRSGLRPSEVKRGGAGRGAAGRELGGDVRPWHDLSYSNSRTEQKRFGRFRGSTDILKHM